MSVYFTVPSRALLTPSLSDPYGTPELRIRRPGSDESEIISTAGDDPYQTEMNHFIDAVS
jgi:hypothetical protein